MRREIVYGFLTGIGIAILTILVLNFLPRDNVGSTNERILSPFDCQQNGYAVEIACLSDGDPLCLCDCLPPLTCEPSFFVGTCPSNPQGLQCLQFYYGDGQFTNLAYIQSIGQSYDLNCCSEHQITVGENDPIAGCYVIEAECDNPPQPPPGPPNVAPRAPPNFRDPNYEA